MSKLIFYRQKRFDGGLRTGLELDGLNVADEFEDGSGERDPTLRWYVELRCEGPSVPSDPYDATDWLLDLAPLAREGFRLLAEQLEVGVDRDLYNLIWSDFPIQPEGANLKIACLAIRRADGLEMSGVVQQFGQQFETLIKMLMDPARAVEVI